MYLQSVNCSAYSLTYFQVQFVKVQYTLNARILLIVH